MRIAFLHSSSDLYGASKILCITISELKKEGHHCLVILSSYGPLVEHLQKAGAEVEISPLGIIRRKYFTVLGLVNRAITLSKAGKTLQQLFVKKKIDLVISNTSAVLVGGLVAKKLALPHIYHIHEIIESPKWFARAINWHINRTSQKLIAVSSAVKNYLSEYVNPDKVQVIYNGLDYQAMTSLNSTLREEIGVDQNEILIGMIGRVHPWKGQIYFLQIAKALRALGCQARFIMAGDVYPGNEYLYDEINNFKSENQMNEHVFDLGFRTDIPEILDALDLFVLPSTSPDPFPTVILEAMSAGTPVAATAQGGALEMIENKASGFHLPLEQAEQAAQLIFDSLQDKTQLKKIGKTGKERVESKFSLKAYGRSFNQLINETVE